MCIWSGVDTHVRSPTHSNTHTHAYIYLCEGMCARWMIVYSSNDENARFIKLFSLGKKTDKSRQQTNNYDCSNADIITSLRTSLKTTTHVQINTSSLHNKTTAPWGDRRLRGDGNAVKLR